MLANVQSLQDVLKIPLYPKKTASKKVLRNKKNLARLAKILTPIFLALSQKWGLIKHDSLLFNSFSRLT